MKILNTKIDSVIIKENNKDGSPLINVKGEAYKQVIIQIPEYPEKTLTCYVGSKAKYPSKELNIVEGETYWIKMEEKVTDKGTFLNFKLASSIDVLEMKVEKLEKQVAYLYKEMKSKPAPVIEDTIEFEDDEPAF